MSLLDALVEVAERGLFQANLLSSPAIVLAVVTALAVQMNYGESSVFDIGSLYSDVGWYISYVICYRVELHCNHV